LSRFGNQLTRERTATEKIERSLREREREKEKEREKERKKEMIYTNIYI
jgi:hypothetical protein